MLTLGRSAFAFAMVGFGLLSLLYVDFIHQLQPIPFWMPGYRLLAILNGVGLIAAGTAIALDRSARVAALALAGFFSLWIVSLQIPSAFMNPALLRSPWWIRTFELVALIGGALALAGLRSEPVRTRWLRGARIAFGVSLPVFGALHLIYPANVASLVPPWYPAPMFWAYFTGFAQIGAGLGIAAGVMPRVASILSGIMYGSWALTLHVPRSWCRFFGSCEFLDAPTVGFAGSRAGLTSLFVAFAMCGSAWIVAGSLARRVEARENARDQPAPPGNSFRYDDSSTAVSREE
jgi:uncharacterized membrane protein YphA (DoxX/SURF4 family)